MNKIALIIAAVFAAGTLPAETISPLVDRVSGHAYSSATSGSPTAPLVPGKIIKQGSVLTTDATSNMLFAPLTAGIASLRDGVVCSPTTLSITKEGAQVTHRDAVFKLDKGSIFSAVEKFAPERTVYRVETPCGTSSAQSMEKGGKGVTWITTVTDQHVHVVVLSGNVLFQSEKNDHTYFLQAGSVFDAHCRQDDKVPVSLVNLITRTAFIFDTNGKITGERPVSDTEVHIAATGFEQAYNVGRSTLPDAISDGLVGSGLIAEANFHLSQINVSLVYLNLPEIMVAGDIPPVLTLADGSFNPANTNGQVISPHSRPSDFGLVFAP